MLADELERTVRSLPALVKQRRGTLGLRAAAEECGVSFNTLSRMERGYTPSVDALVAILRWVSQQ